MAQTRPNKQRRLRKRHRLVTSVRAVYRALSKYPLREGMSARTIHRFINKKDRGRSRRSLSSVKLAISRGVRMGSIHAPRGWGGFRGLRFRRRRARSRVSRRQFKSFRKSARSKSRRRSRRRCISSLRRRSASTRPRKARAQTSRSPSSAVRSRRRPKRRGRRSRSRSASQYSNRSNSSRANTNENFVGAEDNELEWQTASLWDVYGCVLS